MSYNVENLTKLKHLKQLAQRVQSENSKLSQSVSALSSRVDDLAAAAGASEAVTSIRVNGMEQPKTSGAVDISVPQSLSELTNDTGFVMLTDVVSEVTSHGYQTSSDVEAALEPIRSAIPTALSDLTNDCGFQTEAQVSAAIQGAVAGVSQPVFTKVDAIPAAGEAQDNVLYLVMNAGTGHYDIYAKVGQEVVLLDDTTVDLSGYVVKEEGKGLSSNDFTDELKAKLEAGPDTATDAEVTEMLTEVFGAAS